MKKWCFSLIGDFRYNDMSRSAVVVDGTSVVSAKAPHRVTRSDRDESVAVDGLHFGVLTFPLLRSCSDLAFFRWRWIDKRRLFAGPAYVPARFFCIRNTLKMLQNVVVGRGLDALFEDIFNRSTHLSDGCVACRAVFGLVAYGMTLKAGEQTA